MKHFYIAFDPGNEGLQILAFQVKLSISDDLYSSLLSCSACFSGNPFLQNMVFDISHLVAENPEKTLYIVNHNLRAACSSPDQMAVTVYRDGSFRFKLAYAHHINGDFTAWNNYYSDELRILKDDSDDVITDGFVENYAHMPIADRQALVALMPAEVAKRITDTANTLIGSSKEPLDHKQKEDYISKGGVLCPYCGSGNIKGGEFNIDAGTASQEVGCDDCDSAWVDVYKLIDIELR